MKITDGLTPRSNDIIKAMKYSGGFGQPEGFGSVLEVTIKRDGSACLTLHYNQQYSGELNHFWSIELTNEQRLILAQQLENYAPVLWCEVQK